MRASRITRRDTRQERAHSVEQHRNAFSSGQSFIQVSTVADGLASFSFHQGKRKEMRKRRKASGNRKESKQIGQYLTVKYNNLQNTLLIGMQNEKKKVLTFSLRFYGKNTFEEGGKRISTQHENIV